MKILRYHIEPSTGTVGVDFTTDESGSRRRHLVPISTKLLQALAEEIVPQLDMDVASLHDVKPQALTGALFALRGTRREHEALHQEVEKKRQELAQLTSSSSPSVKTPQAPDRNKL